jgi:hypothetical protein
MNIVQACSLGQHARRENRIPGMNMNEQISTFIVFGISLIPYAALSWGYSAFTDGGWPGFWRGFGVLIAVRAFFSLVEGIGGIPVWRLYGRTVAVFPFPRGPVDQVLPGQPLSTEAVF